MEPTSKPVRHKASGGGSKITKYLPRATTFTIPSRPYSPGRASGAEASRPQQPNGGGGGYPHPHSHHHHRSSFSGPISIIPAEARQRKPAATPAEPTSPKVSCIGQVKRHKDAACRAAKAADDSNKKRLALVAAKAKHAQDKAPASSSTNNKNKPPKFVLMRFLRTKSSRTRAKKEEHDEVTAAVTATGSAEAAAAPNLGQLRRFSSGRTALAGFDWRSGNVAVCPLDPPVDSPGMQGRGEDQFHDADHGYYGDDDDSYKIAHSAPMVLGGGGAVAQPTRNPKQVNLWKRRTMAPPKPLQLN